MLWLIYTFRGFYEMGLYYFLPRSPGMHNFQNIFNLKTYSKSYHFCQKVNSFRLIPAANMGEYEPPRERPEDGGLYPLNAEVNMITTNNIHHYHQLKAENGVI